MSTVKPPASPVRQLLEAVRLSAENRFVCCMEFLRSLTTHAGSGVCAGTGLPSWVQCLGHCCHLYARNRMDPVPRGMIGTGTASLLERLRFAPGPERTRELLLKS